jgi:hypothetical protein
MAHCYICDWLVFDVIDASPGDHGFQRHLAFGDCFCLLVSNLGVHILHWCRRSGAASLMALGETRFRGTFNDR